MTQASDKFVKRIQSRLKSQGFSFTKDQIRGVYVAFVKEAQNPSDEEVAQVVQKMKYQGKFQKTDSLEASTEEGLAITASCQQTSNNDELVLIEEVSQDNTDSPSTEEELAIAPPNIIEITPDSNPDIWETLQPPAAPPSELPGEEASLVKTDEKPTTSAGGIIPQDEVKGMVAQTFAGQPQEFTDQVTEYALQHSFENVRQIQDFLEQLRGMEFNLLVKTLEDHFTRRGSMLTVLNEVLTSQQQKDRENRDSFFDSFQTRLARFQQEMESKLAKQSL